MAIPSSDKIRVYSQFRIVQSFSTFIDILFTEVYKMLAFLGLSTACVIGAVVGIILKRRNISDYDRIFSQSRRLWIGEINEKNGI